MTPAQHCLAYGHEIGDGVIAIADELFSLSATSLQFSCAKHTSCRLLAIKAYERTLISSRPVVVVISSAAVITNCCLCMI